MNEGCQGKIVNNFGTFEIQKDPQKLVDRITCKFEYMQLVEVNRGNRSSSSETVTDVRLILIFDTEIQANNSTVPVS